MARKKDQQYTKYIKDPVLEPYFIQLEENCYTVHKNITAESKKEYSQKIGHYKSLYVALSKIAEDTAKRKSYDSIKGFMNEYKTIINNLNQAYNV